MNETNRIIVALDVNDPRKALDLVHQLFDHVSCFKIGLEFIHMILASVLRLDGSAKANQRIKDIQALFDKMKGKVFWDGKLHDIPNTVAASAGIVGNICVRMFNVHATGGARMMKDAKHASVEASKDFGFSPLALAVTILTSLSYDDLAAMGIFSKKNFADPKEEASVKQGYMGDLVKNLALLAQDSGLDGVVCSPKEISVVRRYCGPDFKIVTPGVRPVWASTDDQKRVMTPGEAIRAGADYLVIGRPITKPPAEIGSPADAAKRINDEIADAQKEVA